MYCTGRHEKQKNAPNLDDCFPHCVKSTGVTVCAVCLQVLHEVSDEAGPLIGPALEVQCMCQIVCYRSLCLIDSISEPTASGHCPSD